MKKLILKILILILLLIFLIVICCSYAHYAEQQAIAQSLKEQAQRTEQVESIKYQVADAEAEEVAREETETRIREERRIKQEQEEQAQREAEEQAYQEYLASLYTPVYTTTYTETSDGSLTKSGGVNYYNGRRETWYSSNQLYHRDTANWTAGSDGVYRDKDGYVVVASSDHKKGATVDTSLGKGKVYDSGCASGTTDIYTKW